MRKAQAILGALALVLLIANVIVYTLAFKSAESGLSDAWSSLTEMVGDE